MKRAASRARRGVTGNSLGRVRMMDSKSEPDRAAARIQFALMLLSRCSRCEEAGIACSRCLTRGNIGHHNFKRVTHRLDELWTVMRHAYLPKVSNWDQPTFTGARTRQRVCSKSRHHQCACLLSADFGKIMPAPLIAAIVTMVRNDHNSVSLGKMLSPRCRHRKSFIPPHSCCRKFDRCVSQSHQL